MDTDSQQFEKLLDLLSDDQKVWSDFGILSLSRNDTLFESGENYWRSSIWMPLNYLILRGLKLYYVQHSERADKVYQSLRENLITNIERNYNATGFFFENYNARNGTGQRGFPFNGWTSLISLVVSENYW